MKLPNPWILGWKIGTGIANMSNCGNWECKVY